MREIVLQIPTLDAEQNIDIDVRINGRKRSLKYRVEIVDFDEEQAAGDDKVAVLKKVIKEPTYHSPPQAPSPSSRPPS